ncbi:hypothetical protein DPSP01_008406 [Paraphaeosphaeria sporulosa]|uniref:Siderophore biosynthesis enzyme n=1 Tax=Paraphaeosphaeria sporulosa TaxID=1460663 RepID=A0A177CAC7_9PLEO|nr:uncharacterized protein CC84DRAFT_1164829 [Paraphaeosphaeria sporulosa]OAG04326.1 hypothetical protein CC84DRAFT_1164829 [Paraphaeosphaeria sporulosa]
MKTTLFTVAAFAATALAKTNLEGCTSSQTVAFGGASMIYWDPTNGEICSFLDCGGGRAPPKTTVPGCAQYEGTATYSPDFMPGWGEATATASAAESEKTNFEQGTTTESASAAGESVPAYETKTGASTLVTSAAVLPSGVASGTGITSGITGYVSELTTKGGNATASTGTPTQSAPAENTGAAAALSVRGGLVGVVAGVFGLALL